ncbi:MAG: ComF family protein, partial [Candidatus Cloacimonetes bacterium]|nr:ComF family protein [Candidatus Cloacimonadota bacterium]
MTYFTHLIDIFFPSLCLNCNVRLQKNEEFLCKTCGRNLIFLNNICQICGSPLKDYDQECLFCKDRDFSFDLARSLFLFDDIQNLIHHFKYRQFSRLGKYLAHLMYKYLEENQIFNQVDLVIPIPLHRVKKRER